MISFLDHIISEPMAQAITWTLIHSIWQVSLVAIIMSYFLHLYEDVPSIVRYRISRAALYMVALISMATFIIFYIYFSKNYTYEVFTIHLSDTRSHYIGPSIDESIGVYAWFTQYIFPNSTIITSCWLIGFAVFAFRFCGGYVYTRYIIHSSKPLHNSKIESVLEYTATRLKVSRNIKIATSRIISTPMVIGFFKPYLLLPFGVINHLTIQEVEAIFAHEIAHIKRNDYLHNLVQLIVEAIFYFHPGVWWISSHIRTERENCCDDIAIAYLGDRKQYAKCLLKLEQLQQRQSAPQLSMTLIRKGKLLNRISRILNHPTKNNNSMDRIVITSLFCIMFFVLGFSNKSKLWSESREVTLTETPKLHEKVAPALYPLTLPTIPNSKDDLSNENQSINKESNEPKRSNDVTTIQIQENNRIQFKDIPTLPLKLDTIPRGSSLMIIDENIILKIQDGQVETLILDDKVIPKEEYEDYIERNQDGEITKINDVDITPPPAPPAPLQQLIPPAPPAAPMPPHFRLDSLRNKLSHFGIKIGAMDSILSNLDITLPDHFLNLEHDFDGVKFYHFGDSLQFHHNLFSDSLHLDHFKMSHNFDNILNRTNIFNFNTPTQAILRDLERHDFLESGKTNKIELSAKEMKINGEKQPTNIHNKYKKMYEKKMGHPLHKDTKIILEYDHNDSQRFPHSLKKL